MVWSHVKLACYRQTGGKHLLKYDKVAADFIEILTLFFHPCGYRRLESFGGCLQFLITADPYADMKETRQY